MSAKEIDLYNLTAAEWCEIRSIAVQLLKRKALGDDQFKTAVMAFVTWIATKDDDTSILVPVDDAPSKYEEAAAMAEKVKSKVH